MAAKLILGSFNLPVLAEESRTAQEFLAAMTMHLAQCIKDPTSIKDHMVDLVFILGQTEHDLKRGRMKLSSLWIDHHDSYRASCCN